LIGRFENIRKNLETITRETQTNDRSSNER
jgi:hypothetical protein